MATEVASRDLRNNTAELLRRVSAGEQIVVTTRGKPVASLIPFERSRRRWLPRAELTRRLNVAQADPGLREDLARLAGDTTDDLGPIVCERPARGLLDTSVFIARESGRSVDGALLPEESAISAVTVGELQAGVLAAGDTDVRARRLATLEAVSDIEVLVVDETVAASWARLRVHLAEAGRRLNVNDLWIAATALANAIPVVTQDEDFDPVEGVGGLRVVRV